MERQRVHGKVKNGGQAHARPVVGGEPCPGCGPHAAGGYGSAFVLVVLLVLFARAVPVWAAPPQITSETAFTIDEGTTTVGTLTATDTDTPAAQLTWSIPAGMDGGADADAFSLTAAGVLTFTAAPDYETPTDDDEDNVYAVTVEVSDGTNTDTAALEVTVTNVAEGVPNIVIILADDLGYGDVAHLNPQSQIPTPNLDALAQAGMTFLDAHTPSAVCTPTRYGLLTGRYAWRTRLKRGVLKGYGEPLLASGRATLGSLLKAEGYRTVAIGKWHLGLGFAKNVFGEFEESVTDGPHTHGFDESYIIPTNASPPYVYIHNGRITGFPLGQQSALSFPRYMRPGELGSNFDPPGVLDELIEKAGDFIRQQAADGQTFLLYLPLTAPHKPVWPAVRFEDETELGPYGDFIIQVDAAVGEVMSALDQAEVDDNTLLIFTSDNGSFMRQYGPGERDHADDSTLQGYRSANHTPNHVYRGTKADIWEAGHRVPFFARWPGEITPGSTQAAVISLTDVFATVAEIVGHELSENEAEDSFSLLPPLHGNPWTRPRAAVIHHSSSGMFAIRDGDWKLVAGDGSGGRESPQGRPFQRPYQLFDIASDPSEQHNVYDQHPIVAQRLERKLTCIRSQDRSRGLTDEEGVLTLNLTPDSISESGAKSSRVTATLSPAPSMTTTVTVAAPAGDVTLSQNLTLTITAGKTESTGEVTLTARDNAVDGPETKTVTVSGTPDDVCVAGPVTVMLTIEDDERGVTLAAEGQPIPGGELSIIEGNTGRYTVKLNFEPIAPVTIAVASSETAVGVQPTSLRFTPTTWQTAQTVTIRTEHDPDGYDLAATLTHTVTTVGGSDYTDVTVAAVAVTVTDDESPSTAATLSVNPSAVGEGEVAGRTVTVTGTLNRGVLRQDTEVTVRVAAATATSADFTAVEAFTLEIAAWDQTGPATFTLTPVDDAIDEPNETVTVSGTAPDLSDGVTSATLTITDNDNPPTRVPPFGGGGGGGGGGGEVRDDHGTMPAQATRIVLSAARSASIPGQLHAPDDVDYFGLPLPRAGVLAVETTGPTATRGTVWQDGTMLAQADGGGEQQNFRVRTPVTARPVLVTVEGQDGQTGAYTLEARLLTGYLENPGAAAFQSGIGVLSGWVCEADEVEIQIGDLPVQEAAYGTERLDTAEVCEDTDNGFGLLFNWNLLSDGEHRVVAVVDGVELDRATVQVTTLGQEFLRAATGTCEVEDFPLAGEAVTLVWQQTSQNFVLARGSPPAGTTPDRTSALTGYLENPGHNSFQSGVGVLSGWVCEAETVEITIGDFAPQAAAYGTERLDTAGVCGDTANGFGLLFNWNLLGDGEHVVVARVDGEELGRATVRVTTLGHEFLRGAEGECVVDDFPTLGETVALEWQQSSQNFVITDVAP